VQPIGFVVVHLGEILRAFLHPNMTSCASAVAAASMIETHTVVECDIENRFFLAMIFIRQPAMLKRDRLALRQERDLDCVLAGSIYRGRASGLCFLIGHNSIEDNVPILP